MLTGIIVEAVLEVLSRPAVRKQNGVQISEAAQWKGNSVQK